MPCSYCWCFVWAFFEGGVSAEKIKRFTENLQNDAKCMITRVKKFHDSNGTWEYTTSLLDNLSSCCFQKKQWILKLQPFGWVSSPAGHVNRKMPCSSSAPVATQSNTRPPSLSTTRGQWDINTSDWCRRLCPHVAPLLFLLLLFSQVGSSLKNSRIMSYPGFLGANISGWGLKSCLRVVSRPTLSHTHIYGLCQKQGYWAWRQANWEL